MKWFTKLVASVVILAICGLLIVATAYAFGVNDTIRMWLQYLQMALTVAAIACVWMEQRLMSGAALGTVVSITAGILAANR